MRALKAPEGQPLWDPFCGAGTLLIEAVEATGAAASHSKRSYAFEAWPTHDEQAFQAFSDSLSRFKPPGRVVAYGSDIDSRAIEAAQHNCKESGLSGCIAVAPGDFEDAADSIPQGAAVLTHVPYGVHTPGGEALRRTVRRFHDLLRRRQDLGPVCVLDGSGNFATASALRWDPALRFRNRGLPVVLWRLRR